MIFGKNYFLRVIYDSKNLFFRSLLPEKIEEILLSGQLCWVIIWPLLYSLQFWIFLDFLPFSEILLPAVCPRHSMAVQSFFSRQRLAAGREWLTKYNAKISEAISLSIHLDTILVWFCTRRFFSEDFYLANDHGTIKKDVFNRNSCVMTVTLFSHFS